MIKYGMDPLGNGPGRRIGSGEGVCSCSPLPQSGKFVDARSRASDHHVCGDERLMAIEIWGASHSTYVVKSFHIHGALSAAAFMSASEGALGGSGSDRGEGSAFWPINLTNRTKPKNVARILTRIVRRGIQICHLDGFFQKSGLAGDQLGGGVPGSKGSSRKPIIVRLLLLLGVLARDMRE
jgi:hypothetical protein